MYIYENPQWPVFTWNTKELLEPLTAVRHQQGRLLGRMQSIGFPLQQEATFTFLTQEVIKSSEIEGEFLDEAEVRSSLARHLGLEYGGQVVEVGRNVEGVVEMRLDAVQHFKDPLTQSRLFDWHAGLFPTGRSGIRKIRVGQWRDDATGPMEVLSGAMGKEKIHFRAPPASQLEQEMARFLQWFNEEKLSPPLDPILKAALAHLWFLTIHPFEDGNGRIARTLSDMVLARSEGTVQRFYSLSAQIRLDRKEYYQVLEAAQKGGLEVTPWLVWLIRCLGRAMEAAQVTTEKILYKAQFWQTMATMSLHQRQRDMLNRLLDGFTGALTSSKWAQLTKCSQDTALRDLRDLVEKGILVQSPAGGRSTHYSLRKS